MIDIIRTIAYNIDKNGDIPVCSHSAENNGVGAHVSAIPGRMLFDCRRSICLADRGTFHATVQTKDYYIGTRVKALVLKKNIGADIGALLFVATIINNETYRYSYGRNCTNRTEDIIIKLPAITDKKPDWKGMENYINSLHFKPLSTNNEESRSFSLETDLWKEFLLEDIFTKWEIGKAHDNMLDDGDDCIYLGAKKDDNCIMRHCAHNKELEHDGNCIVFICNGQGSVGYSNYIDREFIAITDLRIGYCKELNKYNALFLVAVLDRERKKYSFGRKWGPHLKKTQIKLPAIKDSSGNICPDWHFMEEYIKSLPYGDRI